MQKSVYEFMYTFSKADVSACDSSNVLLPSPNLWRSEYMRKIALSSAGIDSPGTRQSL